MHGAHELSGKGGVHDFAADGQARMKLGANEHAGLEAHVRVGDIRANVDGTGAFIDQLVDEGNLAGEGFAGVGFGFEGDGLAVANPGEIAFVGFHLQPDVGKVRDGVEFHAGADVNALHRVLLDDDAADGCEDGNVVGSGAAVDDLLNLILGESP